MAYNAWRVVSLASLPAWAIALGLLSLLGAVALSARGVRGEPDRRRRAILIGLRIGVAALLALLLFEPGLELRAETRLRARVALLVDSSRSMGFPDAPGEGHTRAAAAKAFLVAHAAELSTLSQRFSLEAFTFDREPSGSDLSRLVDAKASPLDKGPATDLLGALGAAGQDAGARPLAGVLLLSDGADNVQLGAGIGPEAEGRLRALRAPVFALPLGANAAVDAAVDAVAAEDFAFVRSPVTLEVQVSARGLPEGEVPVLLQRDGQVIGQQLVRLGGKVERATAKLTFVPDRTGSFAFSVSVPPQPGETLLDNNRRAFTLQVIRDRVRVLLVVGHPSWDERFLRQLLKRDPNVDLISFFILRTQGSETRSSPEELSLIPFPTQEIFQDQLKSFDLVIFQDFDHRPYRMSHYLPGIAEYVRGGGAFAMIGGPQSFGAGDYAGTAIEGILPVALPFAGEPAFDETTATVHLTKAGERHPVVELFTGAAQNQAAWARLPPLPGVNHLGAPLPGAQVLLESSEGRPVLVVGEAGRGRTLALATDSSWRWGFLAAGSGEGPRAYETFWHAAIRWLVRDPGYSPLKLEPEKPRFDPEEGPVIAAQVRGADYGPAPGARLSARLVPADAGGSAQSAQAVSSADGSARLVFGSVPAGAYKVVVTASSAEGKPIAEAEQAVVVAPSSPELLQPAPRPDLLALIAKLTAGRVIDRDARLDRLPFRDPQQVEVGQRQSRPLWDRWETLLALCALVAVEWSLRRRWGYA